MIEAKTLSVRVHEAINVAIEQWVALLGVDPEKECWSGFHAFEAHDTYEQLSDAQKLDPSGLTTAMLLRAFVDHLCEDSAFTVNDLLLRPDDVEKELAPLRQIIGTLESEVVKNAVDGFRKWLDEGTASYGIQDDKLKALLDDPFRLAYIRRDAITAIERLRAHQFSIGEADRTEIKYNPKILQFWNVNSLVKGVAHQPISGVTLCLLRDPNAYYSYFVFAIRNGGNIFVLTDKPKEPHPNFRHVARCPGKDFEKRAFQYHFPYHLTEAEFDGKRTRIPRQEGLVLYNQRAIVLADLAALHPNQKIWMTIMLDLIRDKYWRNNLQLPDLSYTAEMIERPRALADQTKHLPVVRSALLEVAPIVPEEFTTDKIVAEQPFGNAPSRHNEWLLDRYRDRVPADCLNIVVDEDAAGVFKDLDDPFRDDAKPKLSTLPVPVRDFIALREKHGIALRGFGPTEFGTEKELRADYQYLARLNQARYVEKLADEEFEKTKDEVFTWYVDRVHANVAALLDSVAEMKFIGVRQVECATFDLSKCVEANILEILNRPKGYLELADGWTWNRLVFDGNQTRLSFRNCYFRKASKASVFGVFRVETTPSIARVCGCEVGELPEVLQHVYPEEPYTGNSILDRLDPMDHALSNPWDQLTLGIVFCLSKTAFHKLRAARGLPKFTDWNSITNKSER